MDGDSFMSSDISEDSRCSSIRASLARNAPSLRRQACTGTFLRLSSGLCLHEAVQCVPVILASSIIGILLSPASIYCNRAGWMLKSPWSVMTTQSWWNPGLNPRRSEWRPVCISDMNAPRNWSIIGFWKAKKRKNGMTFPRRLLYLTVISVY